ncbi:MAG: prepilin-type N-terminal cleavage/methylation domain-containing protein, partial [Bacilli bacterium]
MSKKDGFTLVELLAVIVILGVVLVITIPPITNYIDSAKLQTYINHEETVVKSTKNYLLANDSLLPVEIGDTAEIELSALQEAGYIDKIISPEDKKTECSGYILVTKISDKDYDYVAYLDYSNTISNSSEDALALHYTFDDFQEPTQNLIPNSPANSYPTVGNTHATYNTNQYNNNTYFSIGTIGSVSNNIVTLSSVSHAIYTYDVLTPQTSGGGVTAGTNYYIKKLSDNTFTLHQHNASQDGSLGYSVHDSINNDVRISINATDFPTMWYGLPHAPNSALVKEIIPNCYSSNGAKHECIRLHTEHKIYGPVDGMA